MQMMRIGAKGAGTFALPSPPLLWRGSRIKQQQKHHPLGDSGLHPLPSLRSGFCLPHPLQPTMASARPPTLSGAHYGLQGAALCPESGHSHSQLLIPPQMGERRAWGLLPGADGVALALPAGCSTAQTPVCPLRADPMLSRSCQCPDLSHPLPHSIMASSISKNSLCMGTLPSSFTP